MGDTCGGCCSSYQRQHEQQLQNASRPQYRAHRPLDEDYNNTEKCCCGGESELKMEYKFMEQLSEQRNHEDTKVNEESIETTPSLPNYDVSTATFVHHSVEPKQKKQKELNRFNEITPEKCLDFLIEMKAIVPVYVHKNIYDRWTLSHLTFKRVKDCADLHIAFGDRNKHDSDYKEMKCFSLKNYEKKFDIKKHEIEDFQKLILCAVDICHDIYFLNLNSSSTDSVFLGELFDILVKRNNKRHETNRFGPEILDIENIPIKEDGIALICKYLEANVAHTKWLKIGRCFGYEISFDLSQKLCNALEKNKCVLKMDIELEQQHRKQIDLLLKKNNKDYVNERRKRKMTV